MATELQPPRSVSKTEAFVERTLAQLCRRIRRVDIVAELLTTTLAILAYALLRGVLDRALSFQTWGESIQWATYAVGHATSFLLLVRTIRCALRPINPYFVAHQLEQALPTGNNRLINWLDLRDEELPSAFRRNLSSDAAEQLKECDLDRPISTGKNWLLVVAHSVAIIGLVILLVLGPASFIASMQRAFLPFFGFDIASTQITLVQPMGGHTEVGPNQHVAFTARIEGLVPASHRPDAPTVCYRYQPGEDFRRLPLSAEGNGVFVAQLPATLVRAGFIYKITAGDASTEEFQVHVRARAHVRAFEITYHPRPYRNLPSTTAIFPRADADAPAIHGMRGTGVEVLVRTSRPYAAARVELRGQAVKPVPLTRRSSDAFSFVWTLEQSDQFRVEYMSEDGEENIDRNWHDIHVSEDETPHVVLVQPGKDVALPTNGTLELLGRASDDIGLKSLTLQMRIVAGETLQPKAYRIEGEHAAVVDYRDYVALDQLRSAKGITHDPGVGAVLEYWLEATDTADHPKANTARSAVYRVTLLPAMPEAKQQAERKRAETAQKEHAKKQQKRADMQKNDKKPDGGAGGGDLQQQANELRNNKQDQETGNRIAQALGGGAGQPGEAKSAPPDPDQGGADKGQDSMAPGDAGAPKEGKPAQAGEARDQGMADGNAGDSKAGDSKPGTVPPNEAVRTGTAPPVGEGAKTTPPPMNQPKEPAAAGPAPSAKGGGPSPPGNAKADATDDRTEPTWEELGKLLEKLPQPGADGDAAADRLKEIAYQAADPQKRELAAEILAKNGRDPATGKEAMKGSNPFGTLGRSDGMGDEVKAVAANREFGRRIGAMQLDDWKQRVTPDLLKRAGVSPEEWDRYVRNRQTYDALVRQLNTRHTMAQARALRTPLGVAPTLLETTVPASTHPLDQGRYQPPAELRDAQRRFSTRP